MPEEKAPERESIDVTLGGQVYHLRIGPRELSTIDRAFGRFGTWRGKDEPPVNPLELIDQLVVDFDPEQGSWRLGSQWAAHVVTWAALKRERPSISMDEAGELMGTFEGNQAELAMLLLMAWRVGGLGTARNAPKNAEAEVATGQQQ